MARDIQLTITTSADLKAFDQLARSFDKLQASIAKINTVKGLSGLNTQFANSRSAVQALTRDVAKLESAIKKIGVGNMRQLTNQVNSGVAKGMQQAVRSAEEMAKVNARSAATIAKINAQRDAEIKKIQEKGRVERANERQSANLASKARQETAEIARQNSLYKQQQALVNRVSQTRVNMSKIQDRSQNIAEGSNNLFKRLEDAETRFQQTQQKIRQAWNTTDAGMQQSINTGLTKSLSQLSANLTQVQSKRAVWTGHIRNIQRMREELVKLEAEQKKVIQQDQKNYDSQTDVNKKAEAYSRLDASMSKLSQTQKKISDLDEESRMGNEYWDRSSKALDHYGDVMRQVSDAQQQYHSRLQQLRQAEAAQSQSIQMARQRMESFLHTLSSMAAAVAQFASTMRSKFNSVFSSASTAVHSFSTSVSSKFASLRSTLDATGKGFLGFGKNTEKGISQANIALNEFFSAGWSLLASGSIVKSFGSNLLGRMFGGLSSYTDLEQQLVRLGISGGMWGTPQEAASTGSMRGLEGLIFDLQSGRGTGTAMTAFSAPQLADALYFFSSAIGADLKDQGEAVIKALQPMLRIASVTQTSPETLIKGTLNTMMEFGYNPREMLASGDTEMFTQIAGMIQVASNVSSMEVPDIFEAFKMMGPALNMLSGGQPGAGLDDALAAIFLASEVGLKGGNVGRGIDRLVTQLLDPDGPMGDTIKKYFGDTANIEKLFFNDDGTLRGGLRGVFDTLTSIPGMTEAQLAGFMGELFTQNAARAGAGIAGGNLMGGPDDVGSWDWFTSMMDDDRIEQAMAVSAAAMENTVTAAMTNIGNAWNMIKTEIVESVRGELIDSFNRFADVLWDIGYAIRENPALGRFVAYLGTIVGLVAAGVGSMMVFGGTLLLVARAFSMLGGMIAPVIQGLAYLPTILATISPLFVAMALAAATLYVAWDKNLGGLQDRVHAFIDSLSWEDVVSGLVNIVTWVTRIGSALVQFVEGPLLGVSTDVSNLAALLNDVFGVMLGSYVFTMLERFGASFRSFVSGAKTGTGALGTFASMLSDIRVLAENAGNALQGVGEFFVFGTMQAKNFQAIQRIGAAFDIKDPIQAAINVIKEFQHTIGILVSTADTVISAWKNVGLSILDTLGIIDRFKEPAFGEIGFVDPSGQIEESINRFELLRTTVQTVFAFINGVIIGFGGILTKAAQVAGSAVQMINDALQRFSSNTDSVSDKVQRVAQIIGQVLGVYLGARLIAAVTPGFDILMRLGTYVGQLGILFLGAAVQVGLFAAKVAANLALIGVQLAAQMIQLGVNTTAWALNAAKKAATIAENAALMTSEAGVAAAQTAGTAATLLQAGAFVVLTAAMGVSIALFGAMVLAVAGFAVAIFAVVASTDGLSAGLSAVGDFLSGFIDGLMFAIGIITTFAGAMIAIGEPIFEFVASVTGADSALQAFGLTLGVIAGAALLAAFASLIGLVGTLMLSFLGARGAAAIFGTAIVGIGAGLIGLGGPFATLLDYLDAAIDKFGTFGEVAAIALLSAQGRSWVGAVGKGALGILVKYPAIGAAAAVGVGAYYAYEGYNDREDPTQVGQQLQWTQSEIMNTGAQYSGRPGVLPDYGTPQWDAYMQSLIDMGVYNAGDLPYITSQESFLNSWNYGNAQAPISGEGRYFINSMQGRIPQTVRNNQNTVSGFSAELERQMSALGMDDSTKQGVRAALVPSFENQLGSYQSSSYQDLLAMGMDSNAAVTQAYGASAPTQMYETPNLIEQQSTMDQAVDFLNNTLGMLGLDTTKIADSPWVKENLEFLKAVGMDPANNDWTPDLKNLTDISKDTKYDDMMASIFPGWKDYQAANTRWANWQSMLKATDGDVAKATQQWRDLVGTPVPTGPGSLNQLYNGKSPQEKAQDSAFDQDAYEKFLQDIVPQMTGDKLLAQDIASGLQAVFGRTSSGGAFGGLMGGIMDNISNYKFADGTTLADVAPWFNQDELLANAAIYGGDQYRSMGGKKLSGALTPMLQQTATETGIPLDALMANMPAYYYDESLMPTAQTELYKGLSDLSPEVGAALDQLGTQVDTETGQIFSNMGLDWSHLTQYAISNAMEGTDWDLSHFIMEEWDLTQDQALAYIQQNGLDSRDINSSMFQGIEAAYLTAGGQINVMTSDFYDWLADATQNGTDKVIDITRDQFEQIPESYKIAMSNMGYFFNIVTDGSTKAMDSAQATLNQQLASNKELAALYESLGGQADNWFNALADHDLTAVYDPINDTYDLIDEAGNHVLTLPAAEYNAFLQSLQDIEDIIHNFYENYLVDFWKNKGPQANQPGGVLGEPGDQPGDLPDKYDVFRQQYEENGGVVVPADQALTMLTGIDFDATIQTGHQKSIELANSMQSGFKNSMESDTEIETAIAEALNKAITNAFADQGGLMSTVGTLSDFMTQIFTSEGTAWGTAAAAAFNAAFAVGMSTPTGKQNNSQDPAAPNSDAPTTGLPTIPSEPIKITVDLDTTKFVTNLQLVTSSLVILEGQSVVADVFLQTEGFQLPYQDVYNKLFDIDGQSATPWVDLETADFDAAYDTVYNNLYDFDGDSAMPWVDLETADFDSKALNVTTALNTLNSTVAVPFVYLNDGGAPSALHNIWQQMIDLDNMTATVTVNVVQNGSIPSNASISGGAAGGGFSQLATGGYAQYSGPHWVGEEGMELLWLNAGDYVMNHQESRRFEAGMLDDTSRFAATPFTNMKGYGASAVSNNATLNVTINNPVLQSRNDVREVTRQIKRELGKDINSVMAAQVPRN